MMMITDSHFHDGVNNNTTAINGTSDLEVDNLDTRGTNDEAGRAWWHNIKYLVVGVVFGIVFVKAEVISWFRIQEMFRFQSLPAANLTTPSNPQNTLSKLPGWMRVITGMKLS